MLTRTYRRHRPGSSRRAKLSWGDLPGQVKRLEHARIRENDVAGDQTACDREDLERVQRVPAAGFRRVGGERGLPVGGELPHAPPPPAHLEQPPPQHALVPPPP